MESNFRIPQRERKTFILKKYSISLWSLLIFIILIYMIYSSFYIVPTGSQAVLFRFGKLIDIKDAGIHFKIPIIDSIQIVSVEEIRRYEFGYRTIDPGPPAKYKDVPNESKMLTSDNKIVHVYWAMQYKVSDPAKYVINLPQDTNKLEKLIRDTAESVFRQVVASHSFDEILTTGKELIQTETKQRIQEIMRKLGYGINITAVQIQDVMPPDEVQSAFNDVISARAEKEKTILEAESYANKILAEVKGSASKTINDAEAYKYQRIKEAEGKAKRLELLISKHKEAPTVVETELFYEALKKMSEHGVKFIVVGEGVKVINLDNLLKSLQSSIKGGDNK